MPLVDRIKAKLRPWRSWFPIRLSARVRRTNFSCSLLLCVFSPIISIRLLQSYFFSYYKVDALLRQYKVDAIMHQLYVRVRISI